MISASAGIQWTTFQKLLFKFIFSWMVLFVFSFSFPHQWIPDMGKYTAPFFETIVKWFAVRVLAFKGNYTAELISDSTGLYIHALLTILYAIVITILWTVIDRNKKKYDLLLYTLFTLIRYYLALQLLTYGFSKLFKVQFYFPEPNTLFTALGQTHKDLLYWTAMGVSRPYTMFLGIVEIVAALFLFFRKTFLIGGILAASIFINIVAVNFSFDISVKLYSSFLLCLSMLLIFPFCRSLYRFLILDRPTHIREILPQPFFRPLWLYKFLKTGLVVLVIADPLYSYILARNFNDDKAKRPLFHGAYDVVEYKQAANSSKQWKRVFIHRQGYFITQSANDNMQDYQLLYDTLNKYLVLVNYETIDTSFLQYETLSDSTILLKKEHQQDSTFILLQRIDISALPLLQKEFHWTIDN